jgi:hypothetical protein
MFALEDRPFVSFSPFVALFPDGSASLDSSRPRPAASRVNYCRIPSSVRAARTPRAKVEFSTLPLPARAHKDSTAASREEASRAKRHTVSTCTTAASKPFRICTCKKTGEGGTAVFLCELWSTDGRNSSTMNSYPGITCNSRIMNTYENMERGTPTLPIFR